MKRPVIPIIIALVLAIGAGVAVFYYARGAQDRALQEQRPVSVLVTTDVVPAGTSLGQAQSDGLLAETQTSEQLRPAGAIDVVNASNSELVALADVPAGQMLLSSSFGVAVAQAEALRVPDGLMAVTVLLEDPQKVGTFLRPGSQIAVFSTVKLPASETTPGLATEGGLLTRPLIDRVEVLAVGSTTEAMEAAATADAWTAKLVTVAVDQKQAEKLVHGTQNSVLTMALLGETTTLKPSVGVTDADLFN